MDEYYEFLLNGKLLSQEDFISVRLNEAIIFIITFLSCGLTSTIFLRLLWEQARTCK